MNIINKILNGISTYTSFIFPLKNHSKIVDNYDTEKLVNKYNLKNENGIYSLFDGKTIWAKNILYSAKYEQGSKAINFLKEGLLIFIKDELLERDSLEEVEYIISVIPITKFRQNVNGYSPLDSVLKKVKNDLLKENVLIINNLLFWNRNIKRQSRTKGRENKLENVKNALSVNQNIKNKICFIVDDVSTTGATLEEAKRVLFENGAKDVIPIAIFRFY